MSSAAKEPLDIVLAKYPVSVLEIRNESYKDKKGVWWIRTDAGMKILKKISNSEETLKFILHAVHHLQSNGIFLPEIQSAIDGSDYANLDGTCYVLTNAIEGRNPSYSSSDELKKVVRGLADFHKASAGFQPAAGTKPKYHLGLWVEDYTEQLEDVHSFYAAEAQKSSNTESGTSGKAGQAQNEQSATQAIILKEFPAFSNRAAEAINGLKGEEYGDWCRQAEKAGCLCHQDFAAGNLILTPSGLLYILDTDSLTVDIPARDIRKLLNKVMKKNGKWDASLTKRMLDWYQQVNPMTSSQWKVVKLDLLYPHLFLGAVNKYYYRRDKEWSEEKYLQRIVEMAAFEKSAIPVLEEFDSLAPV